MNENANEPDEKQDALNELFGNVIFAYTREQAIEDGVLVDVTETARKAEFRWSCAVTAAAWALIQEDIPVKHANEDASDRLREVLVAARNCLQISKPQEDILVFEVPLHRSRSKKARFKLHCGPGDHGESVLTLMLPQED